MLTQEDVRIETERRTFLLAVTACVTDAATNQIVIRVPEQLLLQTIMAPYQEFLQFLELRTDRLQMVRNDAHENYERSKLQIEAGQQLLLQELDAAERETRALRVAFGLDVDGV